MNCLDCPAVHRASDTAYLKDAKVPLEHGRSTKLERKRGGLAVRCDRTDKGRLSLATGSDRPRTGRSADPSAR